MIITRRIQGFSVAALLCAQAQAATVSFSASDFLITPVFSNVTTFTFTIELQGGLLAGNSYDSASVVSVQYNVFGQLAAGTPSGFSAFNLQRTITGNDFISQGSSLDFAIAATADLSDGLQASELAGTGPVFVFNGREVGTGRYHPALVTLNSDGSGSIMNSDNTGGINPATGNVVDVDFADEYESSLQFTPAALTLANASAVVPLPAAGLLYPLALLLMGLTARRQG